MKKLITLLLLLTTSAFASITITSGSNSDGYTYDLDITLTSDQYIDAEDFDGSGVGSKLYYQIINVTPSVTGTYSFDNWSSDLTANNSEITETELLFYLDEPQGGYITDAPWAFRTSTGGFGAGLDGTIQTPDRGEDSSYSGFVGDLTLDKGVKYIAVFTSFQADTLGSMDVSVIGNNQLTWAAIPEPSSSALILGWLLFLYVATKRRTD